MVAQQELGSAALAATAVSASLAPSELEDALKLAGTLGLSHRLVPTREVEDERYASNPSRSLLLLQNAPVHRARGRGGRERARATS